MFETITLDELIAQLQEERETYGGDAQVLFASDYGDRGRTQQAHRIRGHVEQVAVAESGYSDSGYAVADEDDMDDRTTYLRLK
jgi:hypothetical protein